MAPASLPRRLLARLSGNAGLTVGANAAIQAAALLGSVLVARRLGADVRGEYAGAAVWTLLLSTLADWGVSQAVPYRCARVPGSAEVLAGDARPGAGIVLGTGLGFAGVAGTVGAIGALLVALAFLGRSPELAGALAAFSLSIPLLLVSTYVAVSCQGLGLVRTYNGVRLLQSLATFGGISLALLAGAQTSVEVLGAIVGGQALATGLALLMLHRRVSATSWRFDRAELRHLLRFGIRMHPGTLARIATTRLDQVAMTVALTRGALGQYAVAAAYAGLVFALASATTESNFARLAADLPPAERLRRLGEGLRRVGRLALLIGGGLAILAPWALPLAFGTAFGASVAPAVILIAAGIVLTLNHQLAIGLRAAGHPILASLSEGGGLLVAAVSLPVVLPRYGIVGAAAVAFAGNLAVLGSLLAVRARAARES